MVQESAMSFFALLLLLVIGAVVLGGLILAGVLLSNRHTRGATIAFGSVVALIAVALIGWRMAATNQMEQHARDQARVFAQREQVRNLEVQAEHLRNIAESYEQHGGIDARQVAEQYREDASGLLQEMRIQQSAIPSHAGNSSSTSWRIGLAGAVVAPLVALLMFLVFKHAGPAIGTVAVAAPLLLLFFWLHLLRAPFELLFAARKHNVVYCPYCPEACRGSRGAHCTTSQCPFTGRTCCY